MRGCVGGGFLLGKDPTPSFEGPLLGFLTEVHTLQERYEAEMRDYQAALTAPSAGAWQPTPRLLAAAQPPLQTQQQAQQQELSDVSRPQLTPTIPASPLRPQAAHRAALQQTTLQDVLAASLRGPAASPAFPQYQQQQQSQEQQQQQQQQQQQPALASMLQQPHQPASASQVAALLAGAQPPGEQAVPGGCRT